MQEMMVIEGYGLGQTTERVNEYLREGWRLHGDMQIHRHSHRDWRAGRYAWQDAVYCIQTLVRDIS